MLTSSVLAHGFVAKPQTEFLPGTMKTTYVTTFKYEFEGKFDDNPQANCDTFTKAFKASQYKTLRDMLKNRGSECGNSDPNASPKPIPQDGIVTFQNPDTGEGFVPSHTGPCEIWLDDKRVFSDDNCAGHYPDKPAAHLKVDFSSCTKNCMLRFYWLALHEPQWQVYKNCVPLIGTGRDTPSMPPAPVPTPASSAPAPGPYPSPSPSTYPTPAPSSPYPTPAPSSRRPAAPRPTPSSPYPAPSPSSYPAPSPRSSSPYPSPSPSTAKPASPSPSTSTPCPGSKHHHHHNQY
ncbi:TPA: hypothetical protein N0F65_012629 [Lagenidium giganteum]|uniref:Uncharacterized protein n=1 Tax=Lagenidium giganteum TaxID=4803 RepID=A0AAV2YBC6_9STRA|nr:TPA: hypothetical protein N0F65_012629 [Lagenidium giganteum]